MLGRLFAARSAAYALRPLQSVGAAPQSTIADELRAALAAEQFELYYQPIVDLISREWLGAEALIRWPHRDGTIRLPAAFLPQAEQAGLMSEIGNWVIARAAHDQLALRLEGLNEAFTISVNVSLSQLQEWSALAGGCRAASRAGASLKLEIGYFALAPENMVKCDHLAALPGLAIAIEEIGLGVEPLVRQSTSAALGFKIESKTILARQKGSPAPQVSREIAGRTVVKAVETDEQVRQLLRLGFTLGQGYLFARPRAFEDFRAALRAVGCLPLR